MFRSVSISDSCPSRLHRDVCHQGVSLAERWWLDADLHMTLQTASPMRVCADELRVSLSNGRRLQTRINAQSFQRSFVDAYPYID
jgi:hypothetical protein